MQAGIIKINIFQILSAIAFVIFCFAIGEVTAILLTGLIFGVDVFQIYELLQEPVDANRSLIIVLTSFSTLFRFLIIPGLYLLFTDKTSLSFLWAHNRTCFTPVFLTIIAIFSLLPFISFLIEFNNRLTLPAWLSEVEGYLRESEKKARLSANFLLLFRDYKDLVLAILIVAIIPGIVEELFFRGVVQMQFQNIFKNQHYALLLSAFLFSCFHFQFYGFLPRLVLGVLFGYLFFWSKNIWYPAIAHVVNNLVGVLGVYFLGPKILNPQSETYSIVVLLPSVLVSVLVILYLRRILMAKSHNEIFS